MQPLYPPRVKRERIKVHKEESLRSYDLTVILRPDEESSARGKEYLKSELAKYGAEIKQETDLGIRDLAYIIQKERKGRYVYFDVSLPTSAVSPIEKHVRLQNDFLKLLFVKKEEKK